MFRSHPAKGRRVLEPIPFMRDIVPGRYCHHLQSERIPTIGRIVAVADAYDAMTTDPAYRKALPHVIACGEMERCSGTQSDPEIVKVFLGHIDEFRKVEAAGGRVVPR
jgi:HD-GYP domain-containing protein (c-di-GMP phosphodiesterase class II)